MPGLPRSLCSSLLFTIDKNYEIDTGLQLYIDLYLVVNSITVCESYVSVTPHVLMGSLNWSGNQPKASDTETVRQYSKVHWNGQP